MPFIDSPVPIQTNYKTAFLFPGQGSQSVGMMAPFLHESVVQDTLAYASDVLAQDITHLIAHGPMEELSLTTQAQPIILACSVAIFRLWQLYHPEQWPDIMAGHSLGEYSALVASGALAFADALRLVRFRAQAMQEAVPVGTGTMAAILGLDDEKIQHICQTLTLENTAKQVVEAVNFNTSGQVVIAGHTALVSTACQILKEHGAKRALLLPVSAPFHTSLMLPAAEKLATYLESITMNMGHVPVLHNVDVSIASNVNAMKQALIQQAAKPVLWAASIEKMRALGVQKMVESGVGRILFGMNKRLPGIENIALDDVEQVRA